MVQTVFWFLATLTLLSGVFLLQLGFFFILEKFNVSNIFTRQRTILAPHAFWLAFAVSLTAMLGSLFFSEIAKFQPCILCWYQRICMYPQTLLLGIALIRKETVLKPYLLALNAVGATIALYHYILQVWPKSLIMPCSVEGGVSCMKGYTFYFGYISIPMMAFTAFMLIIVLLLLPTQKSRKNNHA